MASSLTTTKANSILTAELKTTTRYAALFTADPTDSGSVANEVSGGSYARQAITCGDDPASREISNTAEVAFPVATTNWGTITHLGVCQGSTGSVADMDWHGALTTPKPIDSSDRLVFAVGSITVKFAAAA
ncbi:MAG: hypothetical protein JRD89_06000 [Deltaproteobacteria bacterium]|nr:hypothetical protein [Deltaproteobacteria bacterium]